MPRTSRAAIASGDGSFQIREITVLPPAPDEVLVRVKASGLCHTDYDSMSWGRPVIMGHEGAGVVEEIGDNVQHVQPGDPVLLNWAISCGQCFQCQRGNHAICETHSPVAGIAPLKGHARLESSVLDSKPVERSFNIGTLSDWTVVRKEAVVKMPTDIPFGSACVLGCGVMTGYGSVVNAAHVTPGSSVAVIGCGGVGLNVIQGARIAGALKIIALDLNSGRLEMAKKFGATHTIKTQRSDKELMDAAKNVKALTNGRGSDYAFEATANPTLGAAPLRMARHGGSAIQVSGIEQDLTIDMNLFEWDKTYLNPLYGKCCPERDFPRLFGLYRKGNLLLDELITRTYALDQLQNAIDDMLQGRNAKGVILMES